MNTVQVSSPGKIILSGEHAVLHGATALGVAIQKYCHISIQPLVNQTHSYDIHIPALQCREIVTHAEMATTYHAIQNKPQQPNTTPTLPTPIKLIVYAIACFSQRYEPNHRTSMKIIIGSNIPMAAGMGSSAACLVSLMRALCAYHRITPHQGELARLAIDAENIQHGQSSGFDIYLSLFGGCLYGTPSDKQHITKHLEPISWLHSGTAQSSTKACVMQCRTRFLHDKSLASAFNDTTLAIKQYLIDEPNETQLKHAIKQNHRLLCELGVVSDYAQQLIQSIERQGGAAKISGAGTITGKGCGIIWAVHEAQPLAALAKHHALHNETSNVHYHETSSSN